MCGCDLIRHQRRALVTRCVFALPPYVSKRALVTGCVCALRTLFAIGDAHWWRHPCVCVCIAAISSESGIYRSNGNSGHGWCDRGPSGRFHKQLAVLLSTAPPRCMWDGRGDLLQGAHLPECGQKPVVPIFLQKNLREVGAFIIIFTKSSGKNLRETFRDNVVPRFPL